MSQPTQQLKIQTIKRLRGKEMAMRRESLAFITRPPVKVLAKYSCYLHQNILTVLKRILKFHLT